MTTDTMQPATESSPKLRSFLLWATSIDAAVPIFLTGTGIALMFLRGTPIEGSGLGTAWLFTLIGGVSGAVTGAIVGIGQRLALRRWVSWADEWVKTSVVSWAIGGAVALGLGEVLADAYVQGIGDIGILVAFAGGGIGVGFGQWLLLRHYLKGAGWWIVATGASMLIGGLTLALILLLPFFYRSQVIPVWAVIPIWLLFGTVVATVTWTVLYILVCRCENRAKAERYADLG